MDHEELFQLYTGPKGWDASRVEKTDEQILKEVEEMVEVYKRIMGVTVFAGTSAYKALIEAVHKFDRPVDVYECSYLGPCECILVRNEHITNVYPSHMMMNARPWPRKPKSSDLSGSGKPPHHSG